MLKNFFEEAATKPALQHELEKAVLLATVNVAKTHGYELNMAELQEKYLPKKPVVSCVSTLGTFICTM